MQVRSKIVRVLKLVGRAVLGLLILLCITILLIHLPAVQRQITRKIENYLSTRTNTRVDIQRIRFSLTGKLLIDGVTLQDASQNEIVSIGGMEARSNIWDLFQGQYNIQHIRIADVRATLIENEEGLNIQLILDAFQSDNKTDTNTNGINIHFNKIMLENIALTYSSSIRHVDMDVRFAEFLSEEIDFSSGPLQFKADAVFLKRGSGNILSRQSIPVQRPSDASSSAIQWNPDFGIGIEIATLEIIDSDFAFHLDTNISTPKFDANHIDLKDIQLQAHDILLHEDTLTTHVDSFSVRMPGFEITTSKAMLQLNGQDFKLAGFQFASKKNIFYADLHGRYVPATSHTRDQLTIDVDAKGKVYPKDFAYFFNDSLIQYVTHWDTTNIAFNGHYHKGKGSIEVLKVLTGNSRLEASGEVNEILDMEKFHWKDLVVGAKLGADFKRTIKPFMADLQVPPEINFQVKSSGTPQAVTLDGRLNTTWGDASVKGMVAPMGDRFDIDLDVTGDGVKPDAWTDVPWLGAIDLKASARGTIGSYQDVAFNGFISSIIVMDQPIRDVTFDGNMKGDILHTDVTIDDPTYKSHLLTDISLSETMTNLGKMELTDFNAGHFLRLDSILLVSGNFTTAISMGESAIEGRIKGDSVNFLLGSNIYSVDSMMAAGLLSPDSSQMDMRADDAMLKVQSNFDLLASQDMLQTWAKHAMHRTDSLNQLEGTRSLEVELQLSSPEVFHLFGMDVSDFETLLLHADIDEQTNTAELVASAGKFSGYGITFDSLRTHASVSDGKITAAMDADHLMYEETLIGHLDLDLSTLGDTLSANLQLARDTNDYLHFDTRLYPADHGILFFPKALTLYDREYQFDWNEPVFISDSGVVFDQFVITHDEMQLNIDGDQTAFDLQFRNIDLINLNGLYFNDTAVVTHGVLNGMVSYVEDRQLDLKADIDSLSLYYSEPMQVSVVAQKDGEHIPFDFHLTNSTNKVTARGRYALDQEEIEATLSVDVNDLELFSFLVTDILDEMHGRIQGDATVSGPIENPDVKGQLRFIEAGFTTADPTLIFNIDDDVITFDTSGLTFKDFIIFDEGHHPMQINGLFQIKDLPSYAYDLHFLTKTYTLMNTPESSSKPLKGLLDIGADLKLKGNNKDTYVDAIIHINDNTNLIYVVEDDDIGLLNTDGIIEFVDPGQLFDTTSLEKAESYYDSLVATLANFNVHSTIYINKEAKIRIITNEQSGDYLDASGEAKLDLDYDMSGSPKLTGEYVIDHGVYRVSFYDLVRRNFDLTKGSSITWRGSPTTGDLKISATNTVTSNSVALIGDEVAENELSTYKRSLNYIVRINIEGTIEQPVVSFSLDLSQEDRTSYPALARKLDRLKLPEFQSELNKQVFGLLALGGFLPETTGADLDQGLIATTALTNSVNSLLAGQLNRLAGQYIKGVNIDVGLQSYSDYSSPGGKVKTTLDFKVSKSILNERLSIEIGGDFDINSDQSGGNTGDNYRGDVAIIYDLTGNGDKQLKLFNNESYDIVYQEIRNTGISLIFIRDFNKGEKRKPEKK